MEYETILYERTGGVGLLTLNRPEKMNTWNTQMRQEVRQVLTGVNQDPDVRAILITGAGDKAFSAGADQTERTGGGAISAENIQANNLDPNRATSMLIHTIEKPVIVAVNGVCVGGALAVVTAADIAIASDQARFRVGHARLGMGLMDGLGWLLARRIGDQRAFELYATNRIMDAVEAERVGLVLRTVPHADLKREAMAVATTVAGGPPLGLRWAKKGLARSHTHSFAEYLEFERLVYANCYYSEDSKEARRAFLEKREPKFQGR